MKLNNFNIKNFIGDLPRMLNENFKTLSDILNKFYTDDPDAARNPNKKGIIQNNNGNLDARFSNLDIDGELKSNKITLRIVHGSEIKDISLEEMYDLLKQLDNKVNGGSEILSKKKLK